MSKYIIIAFTLVIVIRYLPNLSDNSHDVQVLPFIPNDEKLVICPVCHGRGVFELLPGDIMSPKQTCTSCNGNGKVSKSTASQIFEMQQALNHRGSTSNQTSTQKMPNTNICAICHGSGKCDYCAGRGFMFYNDGSTYGCDLCHQSGRCQTCHGSGHVY